jgi:hypothetical protein
MGSPATSLQTLFTVGFQDQCLWFVPRYPQISTIFSLHLDKKMLPLSRSLRLRGAAGGAWARLWRGRTPAPAPPLPLPSGGVAPSPPPPTPLPSPFLLATQGSRSQQRHQQPRVWPLRWRSTPRPCTTAAKSPAIPTVSPRQWHPRGGRSWRGGPRRRRAAIAACYRYRCSSCRWISDLVPLPSPCDFPQTLGTTL